MVNTSVARDGRLAALSIEAEYLYLKTIPHLDRDGLAWGEAEALWATVCPRRPGLLPRVAALVDEWLAVDNTGYDAPLVIAYATPQGRALYFPSFTKNQAGMRYEREPVSTVPPPPGFRRTDAGLLPDDRQASAGELPDTFRQTSGNLPADCRPEHEVKHEHEVEQELTPPPPCNKTPRAKTRAPNRRNGGGGVRDKPTCPEDFSQEQYVAWNMVLSSAPDFNGAADFVRAHDARLVAYWCLSAGEKPDTVDNPAGLIRAGVARGEWPRLRGELTARWDAMLRSAAGWRASQGAGP
jgi:hypothetical protein